MKEKPPFELISSEVWINLYMTTTLPSGDICFCNIHNILQANELSILISAFFEVYFTELGKRENNETQVCFIASLRNCVS